MFCLNLHGDMSYENVQNATHCRRLYVFLFLLDPGLLVHGVSGRGAARRLLLRADTDCRAVAATPAGQAMAGPVFYPNEKILIVN